MFCPINIPGREVVSVGLLLLLFAIVGGIAISKLLILIVALLVGAIGFFTRRTA